MNRSRNHEKKDSDNLTHIILWSFCVIFFVFQYGLRSAVPSVLNGELLHYFSISASELGGLIGSFFLAYMIMQIPVGVIIDRASLKGISIFAFCCSSLGIVAFVSTNSLFIAHLSQFFLGFGCSFAFVLIMKVTNNYFPPDRVALISSVGISCGSIGPVIAGPLLAHFSGLYPWRTVVIVMASVGFFLSLAGYFFINEKKLPEIYKDSLDSEQVKSMGIMDSLKLIVSNGQYFLLGGFSMLILGSVSALCDIWGVSFLRVFYGIDKVQAASAISLVYGGMIFGGPLFAYLSKKMGSYKIPMLLGASAILVLLVLIIFLRMNFSLLRCLLFMLGLLTLCQFLSFPAALSKAPREIGATLSGVINMITMFGCTLMVRSVGALLDLSKKSRGASELTYSLQDYQSSMLSLVVAVALSIVLAICIRSDRKK